MKYTVEWLPSAEQELAALWTDSPNRNDVAAAANDLDAALSRDPLALGEARGGRTRIVFSAPLAVLFDVDFTAQKVIVWDLWLWPP
jgi:hypothetical protein